MKRSSLIVALLLLAPLCAGAQTFRDAVLAMVRQAPDLVFPTEAKELGFFSQLGMAIYKPPGDGPFPALVIVHSCGGLRTEIQDWAKEAIARVTSPSSSTASGRAD
jgi:hypothetical protein